MDKPLQTHSCTDRPKGPSVARTASQRPTATWTSPEGPAAKQSRPEGPSATQLGPGGPVANERPRRTCGRTDWTGRAHYYTDWTGWIHRHADWTRRTLNCMDGTKKNLQLYRWEWNDTAALRGLYRPAIARTVPNKLWPNERALMDPQPNRRAGRTLSGTDTARWMHSCMN